MKIFLLILSVLLIGCAQTRVYENGNLVFAMQGDGTNVTFQTARGTSFHADAISHSAPTAAAYRGATALVGGVGSAVVSGLIAAP